MTKLGLFLSLLSAIIGWSEAEENLCIFSVRGLWPRKNLSLKKEMKKGKKATLLMSSEGEESQACAKRNRALRLECSPFPASRAAIEKSMKECETTVAFDRFFYDRYTYEDGHDEYRLTANVSCMEEKIEDVDVIVKQDEIAEYDVSTYICNSKGQQCTIIIPTKNLRTDEGARGFWFLENDEVTLTIDGTTIRTIRSLRFEPKNVTRERTTVAFLYLNGSVKTFGVPSIDATTTKICIWNMRFANRILILSPLSPPDRKIFYRSGKPLIGCRFYVSRNTVTTYGETDQPADAGNSQLVAAKTSSRSSWRSFTQRVSDAFGPRKAPNEEDRLPLFDE